ncbi:MAG: Uncharacterised protein [Flavobacterium sp. SCGC AAA160-P02]|nr:MAG: Uncharacterised protein [Flavobacterium sp. SCGC AAA160-P02]|tara:strand:+ start:237 stop:611 length:375 start_codon:yes stop_codon:yes gene_type:complete
MNKNLALTSLLGLIAIILGAFATHSLRDVLTVQQMNSLETGIRYQIFHVIVLLFVNTYKGFSVLLKKYISSFFFLGIVFFSGSIYCIQILGVSAKNIWFVTPFGGFLLLLGWLLMTLFFLKKKK